MHLIRNVFLHNISIICPSITIYVHNCDSVHSRLFIIGGGELKSTKGTTQGNPIAMAVYVTAIIPLILMTVESTNKTGSTTKTAAYADDITVAGISNIGRIHYANWVQNSDTTLKHLNLGSL